MTVHVDSRLLRLLPGIPLLGTLLACGATGTDTASEPRAPVEVDAAVDQAVATLGDRLTFTLTVDRSEGIEVEVPPLDPEIEALTRIDSGAEEPRRQGGRVIEQRWVRLRVDDVGSHELPPVTVRYRPRSEATDAESGAASDAGTGEAPEEEPNEATEPARDSWETVETAPVSVQVESLLERAERAGEEITDIRGLKPLERPAPEIPWPWIAGGGVLAAALAALLFLWLRRRSKGDESAAPPRPAHEVALERLAALARLDRTDPETVHRLHFELSEVVRTYVEHRFGLNATDLTTEEIVVALPRLPGLGGDTACRLRRFLVDTDRVKFADHRPMETEIEAAFERARTFVETTRPRPEPPESGDAAGDANRGSDPREEAA